jgi:hypothetical protein
MGDSNKKVAIELYDELREVMKGIPDHIQKAEDGGPVISIICEGLGKAISALKSTIR